MEDKDMEDKDKVVHTIRISGLFNAPPSEKELHQAMKEFQGYRDIFDGFRFFSSVSWFLFLC